jgi:hypothetical protein
METIQHIGSLHTIAQVAMALIGFSGIAIIFGERASSKWTPEEIISFYALIAPSFTAFICSFVPILLSTLTTDITLIWKISNGILGIFHAQNFLNFLYKARNAKQSRGQIVNGILALGFIASQFLAAFGILPWLEFIFLLGLIQQLYIGILNFLLLFGEQN